MQILHLNLQELPMFHDLQKEEVDLFVQATGATVRRYEKGVRLLQAYQENNMIGVVVDGMAQVLSEDRWGNEVIGHGLERGAMLGSTSAIMPQLATGTAVEALTTVLVLWIPYRALLTVGTKLGRIHGIVMKNILEAFVRKNVRMMEKVELLSQKTLRERLILYLLQHEKRQGSDWVKVPGRVQLAKELECNRSALTREITAMQAEGLLASEEDRMRLDKKRI